MTAQPGWKLVTPSSAKVSAAKPLRYKATDASHEGSEEGQISDPVGDFSIKGIGNSAKQWAAANPNGRAIYSGGYYTATVTFSGLPANNTDFGRKTVAFSVADVTIDQVFEVFYPAHAYNHPNDGGQHSFYGEPVPNWFFYCKQNAGKDIKYCEERSHSESGKGIETIELGPDAYSGNEFSADTSNDWANPGTNSIQP